MTFYRVDSSQKPLVRFGPYTGPGGMYALWEEILADFAKLQRTGKGKIISPLKGYRVYARHKPNGDVIISVDVTFK